MKKLSRKAILKLGVITGIFVFCVWYANPERRIFSMVKRNLSEYEFAAEQMLNGEVPAGGLDATGVRKVRRMHSGDCVIVDFFVTATAAYYGFYYSPEELVGMPMDENGMDKYTEYEENAWKWQGIGDNDGVIKKIIDGWYYYEASF